MSLVNSPRNCLLPITFITTFLRSTSLSCLQTVSSSRIMSFTYGPNPHWNINCKLFQNTVSDSTTQHLFQSNIFVENPPPKCIVFFVSLKISENNRCRINNLQNRTPLPLEHFNNSIFIVVFTLFRVEKEWVYRMQLSRMTETWTSKGKGRLSSFFHSLHSYMVSFLFLCGCTLVSKKLTAEKFHNR